jgi:hypothetical protein
MGGRSHVGGSWRVELEVSEVRERGRGRARIPWVLWVGEAIIGRMEGEARVGIVEGKATMVGIVEGKAGTMMGVGEGGMRGHPGGHPGGGYRVLPEILRSLIPAGSRIRNSGPKSVHVEDEGGLRGGGRGGGG